MAVIEEDLREEIGQTRSPVRRPTPSFSVVSASRTPLLSTRPSSHDVELSLPGHRRCYLSCFVKAVIMVAAMGSGFSGFASGQSLEGIIDNESVIQAIGIIAAVTYSLFNTNATKELIERITKGEDSSIKKMCCFFLAAIASTPGGFFNF
ncbi:hypothetical protein [Piscirickettsia litoralis]|uniref:DUF4134 domain-containing protein n=1 Tax=Piscirickettsia litoralis TaxID=1891921 RepID=A0ABX2ZZW6_9GAMM|nr:hypothetical protein [Piscirickettsia litoralis]ODN42107.1 hypothetical protein BGC07_03025 [Piscirickettsia litoralis]